LLGFALLPALPCNGRLEDATAVGTPHVPHIHHPVLGMVTAFPNRFPLRVVAYSAGVAQSAPSNNSHDCLTNEFAVCRCGKSCLFWQYFRDGLSCPISPKYQRLLNIPSPRLAPMSGPYPQTACCGPGSAIIGDYGTPPPLAIVTEGISLVAQP